MICEGYNAVKFAPGVGGGRSYYYGWVCERTQQLLWLPTLSILPLLVCMPFCLSCCAVSQAHGFIAATAVNAPCILRHPGAFTSVQRSSAASQNPRLYKLTCIAGVCRACHNVLRAHAAAAKTYRTWYQPNQQGKIGLCTNVVWGEPLTNSEEGESWSAAAAAAWHCDLTLHSLQMHRPGPLVCVGSCSHMTSQYSPVVKACIIVLASMV